MKTGYIRKPNDGYAAPKKLIVSMNTKSKNTPINGANNRAIILI